MNDFQEQILDHYKNPKNFGKPNFMPTHKKKVQNLSCGDEIEIFLLVENGKIKDISFQGEGCSISIAAASLLSEKVKGMSIAEFQKFTFQDLMKILGIDLTTSRLRCASLALEATNEALSTEFN